MNRLTFLRSLLGMPPAIVASLKVAKEHAWKKANPALLDEMHEYPVVAHEQRVFDDREDRIERAIRHCEGEKRKRKFVRIPFTATPDSGSSGLIMVEIDLSGNIPEQVRSAFDLFYPI